jgi:hypothetical protein
MKKNSDYITRHFSLHLNCVENGVVFHYPYVVDDSINLKYSEQVFVSKKDLISFIEKVLDNIYIDE